MIRKRYRVSTPVEVPAFVAHRARLEKRSEESVWSELAETGARVIVNCLNPEEAYPEDPRAAMAWYAAIAGTIRRQETEGMVVSRPYFTVRSDSVLSELLGDSRTRGDAFVLTSCVCAGEVVTRYDELAGDREEDQQAFPGMNRSLRRLIAVPSWGRWGADARAVASSERPMDPSARPVRLPSCGDTRNPHRR